MQRNRGAPGTRGKRSEICFSPRKGECAVTYVEEHDILTLTKKTKRINSKNFSSKRERGRKSHSEEESFHPY